MTVNAQRMLELAEAIHKARWPEDRQIDITPFADEDKNGRDYCFRIARAVAALPPGGESGPLVPWELRCLKPPEACTAPECDCPLADQPQRMRTRWRHKTRGTTYELLGNAIIQTDTSLSDMDPVLVYRCEHDGKLWVRPGREFLDGRFEELSADTRPNSNDTENKEGGAA